MCAHTSTNPVPLACHTYTWSCAPLEHSLLGYKKKTLQKLLFLDGCLSLQDANSLGLAIISNRVVHIQGEETCIVLEGTCIIREGQNVASTSKLPGLEAPTFRSNQLNTHLERVYCVQGKVPGPCSFRSNSNKKRPGWNVECVCVCARANGCVCAHLQTQVYVGINTGWKIWLFICIFFSV